MYLTIQKTNLSPSDGMRKEQEWKPQVSTLGKLFRTVGKNIIQFCFVVTLGVCVMPLVVLVKVSGAIFDVVRRCISLEG